MCRSLLVMAPSSRPDPFSGQQDAPSSSVRYSLDDEPEGPPMSEHRDQYQ